MKQLHRKTLTKLKFCCKIQAKHKLQIIIGRPPLKYDSKSFKFNLKWKKNELFTITKKNDYTKKHATKHKCNTNVYGHCSISKMSSTLGWASKGALTSLYTSWDQLWIHLTQGKLSKHFKKCFLIFNFFLVFKVSFFHRTL